jgi:hypothetical protein
MIVRAHFRPHFRGPLAATPRPPVTLFLASFPLFPKSHRIISFADPHPLTPLESYRFKNRGGGSVSLSLPQPGPCESSRARRGGRDLFFLCLFLTLRSSAFSASLRYLFLFPSVFTSLLLPVVTSISRKAKSCPQNNTLILNVNTRTPAATAAACRSTRTIPPMVPPAQPSAPSMPAVSQRLRLRWTRGSRRRTPHGHRQLHHRR